MIDHPADPYASIAALYDLEHTGFADDIDLYVNLALVTGDPILELGCGTGRLLVPLAQAGHRITGLDRSSEMLARAEIAIREVGVAKRVRLHQAPMTMADQAPGGPFGIVIIALNGLLHLPTFHEQRHALAAARRALDPRGQLVLDLLNPTPDTLRGLDHSVMHEGAWFDPDGSRIDKFAARRVSSTSQTIDTDLWYDRTTSDGSLHRTATSYPMRYIHRAELELMLELAGFAEWHVYGSYELEPFGDGSDRMIVTAEVTPSREGRDR